MSGVIVRERMRSGYVQAAVMTQCTSTGITALTASASHQA